MSTAKVIARPSLRERLGPSTYLAKTPSTRILFHGAMLQVGCVIAQWSGSTLAVHFMDVKEVTGAIDFLFIGRVLRLSGEALMYYGWALVIYASAKVVGETIRDARNVPDARPSASLLSQTASIGSAAEGA